MTAFLPPNLLALFAARDPIPYLPPADKLGFEKKRNGYGGVSIYLKDFEVSCVKHSIYLCKYSHSIYTTASLHTHKYTYSVSKMAETSVAMILLISLCWKTWILPHRYTTHVSKSQLFTRETSTSQLMLCWTYTPVLNHFHTFSIYPSQNLNQNSKQDVSSPV